MPAQSHTNPGGLSNMPDTINERQILRNVNAHLPAIHAAATQSHIPPTLLAGLIAHESSGDQYAIRVEHRYWTTYAPGVYDDLIRTYSRKWPTWAYFPPFLHTSYGLCQLMLPTALELGAHLRFPTSLCDPILNCTLGAQKLRQLLDTHTDDPHLALAAYNGGADRTYPDTVLWWQRHFAV